MSGVASAKGRRQSRFHGYRESKCGATCTPDSARCRRKPALIPPTFKIHFLYFSPREKESPHRLEGPSSCSRSRAGHRRRSRACAVGPLSLGRRWMEAACAPSARLPDPSQAAAGLYQRGGGSPETEEPQGLVLLCPWKAIDCTPPSEHTRELRTHVAVQVP